jgi:hypothetical protein
MSRTPYNQTDAPLVGCALWDARVCDELLWTRFDRVLPENTLNRFSFRLFFSVCSAGFSGRVRRVWYELGFDTDLLLELLLQHSPDHSPRLDLHINRHLDKQCELMGGALCVVSPERWLHSGA